MSSVPGAASTVVRDLLDAQAAAPREAVGRHVGRPRVGRAAGPRLLVPDRPPGPATLPCAVAVPGLRPTTFGALGDLVALDVDGVHGVGQHVHVTRWWEPPRVVPTTGDGFQASQGTGMRLQ